MMRTLLSLACVFLASPVWAQVQPNGLSQGVTPPIFGNPSAIDGSGKVTSAQILAPDGSASAPSYSFANFTGTGTYASTNTLRWAVDGVQVANLTSGRIAANGLTLDLVNQDVSLSRGAANRLDLATGDSFRLVSGSLQFGASVSVANSTGAVTFANSSGLIALGSTQSTDPTCTSNCGTSPTVVGTDSEFTVTMGSSGSPASGFVITFNGTWPSNPQCVGAMAKAGMAVGKLPLTLVTSTTTLTVVTNGTAPATTDIYNFICRAGR